MSDGGSEAVGGGEAPGTRSSSQGLTQDTRQSPVPEFPDRTLERTDAKTLELLVCPLTKTGLDYDEARQELISRRANLAYPIRSGVPLLTREAARNLDDPLS